MRKRGQGEGSIFEEAPGKWRASLSLGRKNGKRIRKSFTARTRREVSEKLAKAVRENQLGVNVAPEHQTLAQFLQTWLNEVAKQTVRPKTFRTYTDIVKLHIAPALDSRPLTRLSPQNIQAFLNDKLGSVLCPYCGRCMPAGKLEPHAVVEHSDEKKLRPLRQTGLGPRTVRHIHATLRDALNVAVKWGLIPRNVAVLVNPPRAVKPEMRAFTPEQARAYLDAAKRDRLEALFGVAVAIGLRQGEILALGWQQIDLDTGRVIVNRALQRVNGKLQFVATKPERARTIILPDVAVSALWKHRVRQEQDRQFAGDKWQETGLVFTTTIGTPIDARAVIRHHHALLKLAKLPRLRFHDLRHSTASLLLAQGASPKYISELLGHSQVSFTMQTYAHVLPEAQKDVAAKMDAILNPVATSVAASKSSQKVQ